MRPFSVLSYGFSVFFEGKKAGFGYDWDTKTALLDG